MVNMLKDVFISKMLLSGHGKYAVGLKENKFVQAILLNPQTKTM